MLTRRPVTDARCYIALMIIEKQDEEISLQKKIECVRVMNRRNQLSIK